MTTNREPGFIPELEDLMLNKATERGMEYSEKEIAVIIRYYNKVPFRRLLEYLPGRPASGVRWKADELKRKGLLTGRTISSRGRR